MNKTKMSLLFFLALGLVAQAQTAPAPRVLDLKASDGTVLKELILPLRNQDLVRCCFIRAIARANPGTALPNNWQRLA